LVFTSAHSAGSIVKKCEFGPMPGVPKKRQAGAPNCESDL
jgi:hypothetical protein